MIKLPYYAALASLVLIPACALKASSASSGNPPHVLSSDWQTLDTAPYSGKRDDISFSSPTHGWYGTGKGDLYATTDGGDNWDLVASRPGTFIRAVGFISNTSGYIGNVGTDYYPGVTDETPLYRTDDGGKNWTPVDLGDTTIKGVCAIDILKTDRIFQGVKQPRTVIHAAGRVGGPTGILRSVDGGANWTVIDMTDHAGMILDVKFFSENVGMVFASSLEADENHGLILSTQDGGKSWKEVYRGSRKGELIWKASFPTRQTGYATVQSYDQTREQQLLIKTTDGGRNWSEIPLTLNAKARQFGIGFIDEKRGWVGTMAGGFYTDDGGASFQSVPIAKAANKFKIVKTELGADIYAIGTQVQRLKLFANGNGGLK